jgi:hypothetical protein
MSGALSHDPTCVDGKVGGTVVEVLYALNAKRGIVQVQTGPLSAVHASPSAVSSSPGDAGKVGAPSPSSANVRSCSTPRAGVSLCTETAAKGPVHAVVAELQDSDAHRFVSVVVSGSGTLKPPITAAQAAVVAEAVDEAF